MPYSREQVGAFVDRMTAWYAAAAPKGPVAVHDWAEAAQVFMPMGQADAERRR